MLQFVRVQDAVSLSPFTPRPQVFEYEDGGRVSRVTVYIFSKVLFI